MEKTTKKSTREIQNQNLRKGGKPGNKGGTGRPPSWLREKCQSIIDRDKLVEFLADVAAGRVNDHKVIDGEIVEIPASLHDRRECAIELIDRGFGKAIQMLGEDKENPFKGSIVLLPPQEIGERGGIVS